MPEPDNLDRLLDSALTTYARAGSGIDLETRILTGIERVRTRRRARNPLLWGGVLALAASILLLLVVNTRSPHISRTTQTQHPLTARTPAGLEEPAPHATTPSKPHRVDAIACRRRARPSPLPKLAVFPSPQPLNAEETALVHLANKTTDEERKGIRDAQRKTAEPLHIAAISIPPIEPPAEGKE